MTYSRKIQKLGESLYVSLPMSWVKQMQIQKGDTIELVQQPPNSLVLYGHTTEGKAHTITLTLTTTESINSIKRKLTGAYLDGYDIIQLSFNNRIPLQLQNALRDIIDEFFGLEIITISATEITTQCLLSKTLPILNIIQRIHDIIITSLHESTSAFLRLNTNILEDIIRRKREVQRLTLVVNRLLRMSILFPGKTSTLTLIDNVDYQRVLDKMNSVFKTVIQISANATSLQQALTPEIEKSLQQLSEDIIDAYDKAIKALTLKEITMANQILDHTTVPQIHNFKQTSYTPAQIANIIAIRSFQDNLQHILSFAQDIAELAIDKSEEPQQ